jgi:hypothetical protein
VHKTTYEKKQNEIIGEVADGILIGGLNVASFLNFFTTLFPRKINNVRCFPVLIQHDFDTFWLKSVYSPNKNTENSTLFILDANGGLRSPLETEILSLYHSVATDRISIGYWTGTRTSGEMLSKVYSGLALTNTNVNAPPAQPFFSILMPVYNREKTICRAIQSIQKSNFGNFECVIIDDGSTDNSGTVIADAIKDDQRFVMIRLCSNAGLGAALAVAALNSFGKWITRCDSDDEYMPNHLESRVAYIAENPDVTVLYGGMVSVNGSDTIPLKSGAIVPVSQTAQGPTLFFKRPVMDHIGTFASVRYGEDEEFLNRALQNGENVAKVNLNTYRYYRDTPNSLTANYVKNIS